jgi:hypothetical protein
MGQTPSNDYTRAPVIAAHESIYHSEPPPLKTRGTEATSSKLVAPSGDSGARLIASIMEANAFVSPQDLRFCTVRDVEEVSKLLLSSRDLPTVAAPKHVTSSTALPGGGAGGRPSASSFAPAGAPLDLFLDHMLKHNKFQDVLSEVQPEVLLAAVRVLQQQQRREGAAHVISAPGSGRVNEISVGVAPCAAVRSVGRMLFEHQLYRLHVMPHIDDAFLNALYVGSSSLGPKSFV